MKFATSSSLYDSASSRAQAPQAGAAEKSINKGLFWALASASAASTSFFQLTSIAQPFFEKSVVRFERTDKHLSRGRPLLCRTRHKDQTDFSYSCRFV